MIVPHLAPPGAGAASQLPQAGAVETCRLACASPAVPASPLIIKRCRSSGIFVLSRIFCFNRLVGTNLQAQFLATLADG